jgi:hypothetical protein
MVHSSSELLGETLEDLRKSLDHSDLPSRGSKLTLVKRLLRVHRVKSHPLPSFVLTPSPLASASTTFDNSSRGMYKAQYPNKATSLLPLRLSQPVS